MELHSERPTFALLFFVAIVKEEYYKEKAIWNWKREKELEGNKEQDCSLDAEEEGKEANKTSGEEKSIN